MIWHHEVPISRDTFCCTEVYLLLNKLIVSKSSRGRGIRRYGPWERWHQCAPPASPHGLPSPLATPPEAPTHRPPARHMRFDNDLRSIDVPPPAGGRNRSPATKKTGDPLLTLPVSTCAGKSVCVYKLVQHGTNSPPSPLAQHNVSFCLLFLRMIFFIRSLHPTIYIYIQLF